MPQLAVFDIDGTLTATNEVDVRCFLAAHKAHLGAAEVARHWGGFSHMTDKCINHEIFDRITGRPPEPAETEAIQTDFCARLRAEYDADASQFAPVAGAVAALSQLTGGAGWAVALATGGWGASARLKLELAGIDGACLPGAFGHEFFSRAEIVGAAIDRAKAAHRVDGFERIVSIGDGAWDVATARKMGLPFVGLTTRDDGETLRAAGAIHLLSDYTDLDALLDRLEHAEAP